MRLSFWHELHTSRGEGEKKKRKIVVYLSRTRQKLEKREKKGGEPPPPGRKKGRRDGLLLSCQGKKTYLRYLAEERGGKNDSCSIRGA